MGRGNGVQFAAKHPQTTDLMNDQRPDQKGKQS
jgi:hypothetical protein